MNFKHARHQHPSHQLNLQYGTPDTRLLHLQDGVWENIEASTDRH